VLATLYADTLRVPDCVFTISPSGPADVQVGCGRTLTVIVLDVLPPGPVQIIVELKVEVKGPAFAPTKLDSACGLPSRRQEVALDESQNSKVEVL
jgi:hypothetical protein